jgi:hypothetical protein
MEALRLIKNPFEGGSRSDFVIVGHPEYHCGRAGIDHLGGEGREVLRKFDRTSVPMKPIRSAVVDRFKAQGGTQRALIKRLSTVAHASPKERALSKGSGGAEGSLKVFASDVRMDFDRFLSLVRSPEVLRSCASSRITAGSANHLGSSGACRHHERLQGELADLAERLRRDPTGSERDLLMNDSWRYYAVILEQARRRSLPLRARDDVATKSLPHLHTD